MASQKMTLAGEIDKMIKDRMKISEDGVFRGYIKSDAFIGGVFTTRNWEPSLYNTADDDYINIYKQMQFWKTGDTVVGAQGFVTDINGNANIFGTVYGAGAGNDTNVNKGYINKDTNGFNLFYVSSNNTASGFRLKNGAIETTHPITVNANLSDAFVLNSTNWNKKLELTNSNADTSLTTILQDGNRTLGINKGNIGSVNADVITGTYLSTTTWNNNGGLNDYQILYRQYHQFIDLNGNVKMAMGFVTPPSGGSSVPAIVLGAGAGNASNIGKGYITKDTNGLNLYHVSSSNVANGITISDTGIRCTKALTLDETLSQTYLTQSGWVSNLTQKLNASGNFGVGLSGKRIELSDTLLSKNSSGYKQGLYIDPDWSDLTLYYNDSVLLKMENLAGGVGFKYGTVEKFSIGASGFVFGTSSNTINVDFSYATITGLNVTAKYA